MNEHKTGKATNASLHSLQLLTDFLIVILKHKRRPIAFYKREFERQYDNVNKAIFDGKQRPANVVKKTPKINENVYRVSL